MATSSAVVPSQTQVRIFSAVMIWKNNAPALVVFMIGCAAAAFLLFAADGFVSNDDYYHSRIAAQIIEQRTLRVDFPWLPLTILNPQQFVDHHLLYHIYLSPWMVWGGLPAVKIAQSLVVGGLFLALWSLLKMLGVKSAMLWTIGLLGVSAPFLYRMLMIRTQAAAVLLLLIALHLLFRKRYVWMIGLAFAFTWLYNGFVLLPGVVALYCISVFITERRFVWQPLAYTLVGVALGLVINPYFPQNVTFIIEHLGEKVDIEGNIRVGNEWYPYTTGALLANSTGALLALAAGLLAPSFRKSGRDAIETTLLLVALLTLYMTAESRRFIEYFPAFALLFCAVAWGRGDIDWRINLTSVLVKRGARAFYWTSLIVPLVLFGWVTLHSVHADVRNAEDIRYMAGASQWLQEHTEPNALIFQTDWDDFTYLFYHNTHNTYLVGLDPTYLQVADPTLWNLWVPITQGQVERPSVLIRDTFGAEYVVSDTYHQAFAERADADPNMQLVYRDDNSLIWRVGKDDAEG